MAMTVSGAKGGQSSDINVTPLIDVLLVLIIIFMVITPLQPKGLNALVPQPNPNKEKQQNNNADRTVVVQVLMGGVVKINQTASSWDNLGAQLEDIYKTRAEKVLFIKGDDDVPFAQIARVLDIAKGADPDIKVGLLTAKIESGQ